MFRSAAALALPKEKRPEPVEALEPFEMRAPSPLGLRSLHQLVDLVEAHLV